MTGHHHHCWLAQLSQLCIALSLAFGADLANAAGLERLLMPGRVIEGHADIENSCDACHDVTSDKASAALCTSCHEDIGADRAARSGFHGRFPAAQNNECTVCHTDHEGRNADIVNIGSGLFDHLWTNFALSGAHASTPCATCHVPDQKYRDASTGCVDCHSKDDIHKGGLGESCESCHSSAKWDKNSFDHEATGYRLTGAHLNVICGDCHRDNSYSSTPQKCATCHAIDDVHAGSNGDACADCHATSSWQGIRFDHANTGFSLVDGHGGLQCSDCHRRDDFKDSFDEGCIVCHKADDDHQGRNGIECDSCHQPTLWTETLFEHSETDFSLVGAHTDLNCSACHKDAAMDIVPGTCGDCHSIDDSHAGQLGSQCDQCHTQSKWHADIRFDHDISPFPLTGLHATVACGACHDSNLFHEAPTECVDCHRNEDPHEGTLGDNCGLCHNSNSWVRTSFDHNLHTSFPLTGGHSEVGCNDCHRDTAASATDVPSSCGGCHASDDIHRGSFGTQCDDCHSVASFKDVESLSRRSP